MVHPRRLPVGVEFGLGAGHTMDPLNRGFTAGEHPVGKRARR